MSVRSRLRALEKARARREHVRGEQPISIVETACHDPSAVDTEEARRVRAERLSDCEPGVITFVPAVPDA